MPTVAIELASGTRRAVSYCGAQDLRAALAACDVKMMYDAIGTVHTVEAVVAEKAPRSVYALSPNSRRARGGLVRIDAAWTALCVAATLAGALRAVRVNLPPWWLLLAAASLLLWECSVRSRRCPRGAALAATGALVVVAYADVWTGVATRVLYAAIEPGACSWNGCSSRLCTDATWGSDAYCLHTVHERARAAVSYTAAAIGGALAWTSACGSATSVRAMCTGAVAYCALAVVRASGALDSLPPPAHA